MSNVINRGYGVPWNRLGNVIFAEAHGFRYEAELDEEIDGVGEASLKYAKVFGHGKYLFSPGGGYMNGTTFLSVFKTICEDHHEVVSRACWAVQQKTKNPDWEDWANLQTGLIGNEDSVSESKNSCTPSDENDNCGTPEVVDIASIVVDALKNAGYLVPMKSNLI